MYSRIKERQCVYNNCKYELAFRVSLSRTLMFYVIKCLNQITLRLFSRESGRAAGSASDIPPSSHRYSIALRRSDRRI